MFSLFFGWVLSCVLPPCKWIHEFPLLNVFIFKHDHLYCPLAFRKKHVSAILNIRGMTRQAERQEILNVVKDIESSDGSSDGGLARLSRDHALFSEVPVTSEVHCLNVGLSRIAITASSCFTTLRPHSHKTRRPVPENPNDILWAAIKVRKGEMIHDLLTLIPSVPCSTAMFSKTRTITVVN